MNDILFHKDSYLFSYRVAGILIRDGKVLLQKPKDNGDYAFPGGHVAFGESTADTLRREFSEEVGADIVVGELKWVEENFLRWNDDDCQQICLCYRVTLNDKNQIPLDGSFVSREYSEGNDKAIYFHWIPLDKVKNITVYPDKAADLLLRLDEGVQHLIYREG